MQQMDIWWIGAAMESFSHNLNERDWKLRFVVKATIFFSEMMCNYVYWMKIKMPQN